jgi:serine/arginine repetitive matrix protein 1
MAEGNCSHSPGFFKGTSADQDRRFSDKEVKLLKSMKFPSEFDKKVPSLFFFAPKTRPTPLRRWICAK